MAVCGDPEIALPQFSVMYCVALISESPEQSTITLVKVRMTELCLDWGSLLSGG